MPDSAIIALADLLRLAASTRSMWTRRKAVARSATPKDLKGKAAVFSPLNLKMEGFSDASLC
jgi:hypothetical protein